MPDEKDLDLSPDGDASEDQPVSEQPESDTPPEEAPPEGDNAESAEGGEAEEQPAEADIPADLDPAEALNEIDDSAESAEDFKTVNDGDVGEGEAEAAMMAMLEDLPEEESRTSPEDIDFGSAQVSRAEFAQLQEPAGAQDQKNIELLMDVDLPVSIELGRTRMPIADILALGPGSVVELNKLAGEPVDLMVNNKMVARGEVVVVDENFGLRITQLMTPEERLKSLGRD